MPPDKGQASPARSLFSGDLQTDSSTVRSAMVAVRKDNAAPTGLENFADGSATTISLLTELGATALRLGIFSKGDPG